MYDIIAIKMSPKNKTKKSQAIRDKEFGRRVKAVRKHLKLKQREMSAKLNITLTTLSDIETGKSYPCYDFFFNMVEHFDVNLYYLLFGRGEMLVLPGTGSPPGKDKVKDETEITLTVERQDLREFLRHFFGSRVLQYHMMSEYFKFFNKNSTEIEREIEAQEKEGGIRDRQDFRK